MKIIGILMVVIVAAMGGLIAYKANERTKTERTLDDKVRDWTTPIGVEFGELAGHSASVAAAMNMFNSELGCAVLVPKTPGRIRLNMAQGMPCDLMPKEQSPAHRHGEAWGCLKVGKVDRVDIEVTQPGSLRHSYTVYAHEFGHALGLVDDFMSPSSPAGLMVENIADFDEVFLSEADRMALRTKWCPQ